MANTLRVVNMGLSPVAVPQFTDVIDPAEDRSDVQKTVNADDLDLTNLAVHDAVAFVDGTVVSAAAQEISATVTLTAADLTDGARNFVVLDGSAAAVTVTLPLTTTLAAGTEVWFYAANVDNALNVDDNVADTIDSGAGPVNLAAVGDILRLRNDGVSDWDNTDT